MYLAVSKCGCRCCNNEFTRSYSTCRIINLGDDQSSDVSVYETMVNSVFGLELSVLGDRSYRTGVAGQAGGVGAV